VDAKTHTHPLCRARLFGVDGRNLAVVFRLDPRAVQRSIPLTE